MAWFDAAPVKGIVPHTVDFENLSLGSITAWQWDFGDGVHSIELNPTHLYTRAGKFTVALTVTGPDGSDTYVRNNFIIVTPNEVYLPMIRKE
jgi:PKD repeat protein